MHNSSQAIVCHFGESASQFLLDDIDIGSHARTSSLGTGGGTDHDDSSILPRPEYRWEGILEDLCSQARRSNTELVGQRNWRYGSGYLRFGGQGRYQRDLLLKWLLSMENMNYTDEAYNNSYTDEIYDTLSCYEVFCRFLWSDSLVVRCLFVEGTPLSAFDVLGANEGLDRFSFWLIFFCRFSIAFLTAPLPPDSASASWRAFRRSSFFAARSTKLSAKYD